MPSNRGPEPLWPRCNLISKQIWGGPKMWLRLLGTPTRRLQCPSMCQWQHQWKSANNCAYRVPFIGIGSNIFENTFNTLEQWWYAWLICHLTFYLLKKNDMTFSPMMFSVPRLDDTSATNIHGQQSAEATSRQHDLAASGGHFSAHRSNVAKAWQLRPRDAKCNEPYGTCQCSNSKWSELKWPKWEGP